MAPIPAAHSSTGSAGSSICPECGSFFRYGTGLITKPTIIVSLAFSTLSALIIFVAYVCSFIVKPARIRKTWWPCRYGLRTSIACAIIYQGLDIIQNSAWNSTGPIYYGLFLVDPFHDLFMALFGCIFANTLWNMIWLRFQTLDYSTTQRAVAKFDRFQKYVVNGVLLLTSLALLIATTAFVAILLSGSPAAQKTYFSQDTLRTVFTIALHLFLTAASIALVAFTIRLRSSCSTAAAAATSNTESSFFHLHSSPTSRLPAYPTLLLAAAALFGASHAAETAVHIAYAFSSHPPLAPGSDYALRGALVALPAALAAGCAVAAALRPEWDAFAEERGAGAEPELVLGRAEVRGLGVVVEEEGAEREVGVGYQVHIAKG